MRSSRTATGVGAGTAMCIGSGAAFGAMAIFGKLAYEEGATVGTLLAVRFALAAMLFWVGILVRGVAPAIGSLRRRDVGAGLALGAFGYSVQAGCYFAALERIDASLLSLLLYTFPAMVTVAAFVLGRERLDRRRLTALALALGGILLVVAGAGTGSLDPVGVALGLTAALVYTTYILVSDSVVGRMQPVVLSALVCTGAAVSLTIASALLGQLHLGQVTAVGWVWLGGIAVVSTVGAIVLFFAGLRRAGPTTRLDPRHRGASRDRVAGLPRVRRDAWRAAAGRRHAGADCGGGAELLTAGFDARPPGNGDVWTSRQSPARSSSFRRTRLRMSTSRSLATRC